MKTFSGRWVLVPLGAEEQLVLAEGYLRHGHRESAANIYLELVADVNFSLELWETLSAGLCAVGRWLPALAFCRQVVRDRPDDDRAYFSMAQVLGRLGRPPELALNLLYKAISLNPVEPRYRVALTVHLMRMGRCEDAYDALLELSPQSLAAISCRCCLQKVMQLCIERGDGYRSAAVAQRLAALNQSRLRRGAQENAQ